MGAVTTTTERRTHVPTEEEVEECRRLYMSTGNLIRTITEKKWVTRRVLNPQPPAGFEPASYGEVHGRGENGELDEEDVLGWGVSNADGTEGYVLPARPGERRLLASPHWRANNGTVRIYERGTGILRFGADVEDMWEAPWWKGGDWKRINASWLMPRWATRVAVDVESARIEQLGEITTADVLAEGLRYLDPAEAKPMFRREWEELHGDGAFEEEQWVCRIEYSLVKAQDDGQG